MKETSALKKDITGKVNFKFLFENIMSSSCGYTQTWNIIFPNSTVLTGKVHIQTE